MWWKSYRASPQPLPTAPLNLGESVGWWGDEKGRYGVVVPSRLLIDDAKISYPFNPLRGDQQPGRGLTLTTLDLGLLKQTSHRIVATDPAATRYEIIIDYPQILLSTLVATSLRAGVARDLIRPTGGVSLNEYLTRQIQQTFLDYYRVSALTLLVSYTGSPGQPTFRPRLVADVATGTSVEITKTKARIVYRVIRPVQTDGFIYSYNIEFSTS